jgi:hypothetical protein
LGLVVRGCRQPCLSGDVFLKRKRPLHKLKYLRQDSGVLSSILLVAFAEIYPPAVVVNVDQ